MGVGRGTQRSKDTSGGGCPGLSLLLVIRSFGWDPSIRLVERRATRFSADLSPESAPSLQEMCWARRDPPNPSHQAGLAVLTSVGEPFHPVLETTQVTVTLPGVVPNLQQLQAC